jgi:hypothetical protein
VAPAHAFEPSPLSCSDVMTLAVPDFTVIFWPNTGCSKPGLAKMLDAIAVPQYTSPLTSIPARGALATDTLPDTVAAPKAVGIEAKKNVRRISPRIAS